MVEYALIVGLIALTLVASMSRLALTFSSMVELGIAKVAPDWPN